VAVEEGGRPARRSPRRRCYCSRHQCMF
jgi:hypothetical protein